MQSPSNLHILKTRDDSIVDQDGDNWRIASTLHEILMGEWQIYEEKPKLVWRKEGKYIATVDEQHDYYITAYDNNAWTLSFKKNQGYNRFIGLFRSNLLETKQAAQEHYEENN